MIYTNFLSSCLLMFKFHTCLACFSLNVFVCVIYLLLNGVYFQFLCWKHSLLNDHFHLFIHVFFIHIYLFILHNVFFCMNEIQFNGMCVCFIILYFLLLFISVVSMFVVQSYDGKSHIFIQHCA